MLILFKSYGDHSNRLFQNVRIETFCIKHNITLINPTFGDLSKYYNNPVNSNHYGISKILSNKIFALILIKLKIFNAITFTNKKNINVLLKNPSKDFYAHDWQYKVDYFTEEYQDLMIEKYSLKEIYYKDNPLYLDLLNINRLKTSIIGIHIRKGDYKTWKDGKYYFEDETYLSFMENMEKEILKKENKKCLFIIFSNVKTSFEESENIQISNNTWYIDHFIMGKCDYLIGPPSTFTMWASYIGKTKYLHMESSSQKIDLKHFKYWTYGEEN